MYGGDKRQLCNLLFKRLFYIGLDERYTDTERESGKERERGIARKEKYRIYCSYNTILPVFAISTVDW